MTTPERPQSADAHCDLFVDLSGLRCPLPVLRTKKALSQLTRGGLLCVFATDADAKQDIPAFARQAGHAVERQEADGGGFRFYIRKQ